jgi:hypothetical protein
MEFYNANGLVNGNIPAETECPFWDSCGRRGENCPSEANGNLRPHSFSCALARLTSLVKLGEEKKTEEVK